MIAAAVVARFSPSNSVVNVPARAVHGLAAGAGFARAPVCVSMIGGGPGLDSDHWIRRAVLGPKSAPERAEASGWGDRTVDFARGKNGRPDADRPGVDVRRRWRQRLVDWFRREFVRGLLRLPPARFVAGLIDRRDEEGARRERVLLGRRGLLLSWQRGAAGGWTARLSGPGLVRTIERTAWSRARAITLAVRAFDRILALRVRASRRASPAPWDLPDLTDPF